MKKILQIIDTPNWAISKLSNEIVKYNPKYDFKTIFVHPKDLEHNEVDLGTIKKDIEWADLIDCQYWRTCSQLLEKIPEMKNKKIILTHHNEKNLLSYDWKDINLHIAKTKISFDKLSEIYPDKVVLIYNSYNHEIFKYNDEYPPEKKAVGYVGRTVPWKGLKEIAKACYELNYPLMIMGKIDKPNYFNEIPEEHKDNIIWDYLDCSDDQRPKFYKEITIYVGNSGHGREVGTLGVIEAMGCGVPVVSTRAGIINDIGEDEVNCLIPDFDDYESLKEKIQTLMQSVPLRSRLRKNAWNMIKSFNNYRMAKQYSIEYNKLLFDKSDLISVIIPATKEREDSVSKILSALENQTYKNIEAIIIWDDEEKEDVGVIGAEKLSFPVIQLKTNHKGYNLAMARNIGIIEAEGKYILFCDSRLLPESNCIKEFLNNKKDNCWLFGNKGTEKTTFVENFSFIERQSIINGGMFNERINEYGGMSQEVRSRFKSQGFDFELITEAKAKEIKTSKLRSDRRDQILKMKNLLWKIKL